MRGLTRIVTPFVMAMTLAHAAIAADFKGHKYKGTIESIEGNKMHLLIDDRESMTFLISSKTDVTRDERPAEISDLADGDLAIITAAHVEKGLYAKSIFAMEPR